MGVPEEVVWQGSWFSSAFRVPRLAFGVLLLVVVVPGYCQRPTSSSLTIPPDPVRVTRLRLNGLAPEPLILTHFLENGFAPTTKPTDLPTTPALKTQIVIDAIIESARLQSVQATPVLGRLANGIPSNGVRRIIAWDSEQLRSAERPRFEAETVKILRLNAIVALGLIGDAESGYELSTVMRLEKDPELKIPCALALAAMGWRSGLSYLIDEVCRANRTTSPAAAQVLKTITGRDFGPEADDPVARREAAAKKWKSWWHSEGKNFRPDRTEILARRLVPPRRTIPRMPATVRDLLDCVAYPNDPRWAIDGYTAYSQLLSKGAAVFDELEKIVADKNENLRVRREAILLFTQMTTAAHGDRPAATDQPKRAYRAIRWLGWDRNPEIGETARKCLARLRKAR